MIKIFSIFLLFFSVLVFSQKKWDLKFYNELVGSEYVIYAIDYRLMAPFSFPIWLVYFRKIYSVLGKFTYGITVLSLMTGFVFTWLSRGNYLENRREITKFLKSEKMEDIPLKFYMENEKELDKIQIAELISTVNPRVNVTFKAEDTLKNNTLTQYKVLQKIKIDTNQFQ